MPDSEKIIVRNHSHLDFVDASSRILIDMMNAVGTDRFAHYGDFTAIEKNLMVFGDGRFSLQFSPEGLTVREQSSDGSSFLRSFSPLQLPEFPGNAGPMDCLFLCEKLKLAHKNVDQVHGRVIRVFCDNRMGCSTDAVASLKFLNATGTFEVLEEIHCFLNESFAFEKKFFKINTIPGIFSLLFKPSRSRLFVMDYATYFKHEPLCITANLKLVTTRTNMAMAWLQNCGDVGRLDWEYLRERQGIFLLPYSKDDPLAARNAVAEALAFSAEARKNGIKITIKRLMVANPEPIPLTEPLRMEDIDENQVLAEAEKYRLPIPLILKGDPCQIELNPTRKAPEPLIQEILDRHAMTYFYGSSCSHLIPNILSVFQGSFCPQGKSEPPPLKTVLIIPPERAHRIKKMLPGVSAENLKVFISHKLDEKDGIAGVLEDAPDVVLFLCQGEPSAKILNAVDICLSASKTVGVFDDSEGAKIEFSEMADKVIFVASARENNYFIKNMKTHNVHKFNFQGTAVEVTASTEDELADFLEK